ncbi:hypothetical protein CPter91_0431 [Collimonas pratensis]|uniref:Uncharacterized protein n=1 Tax=Collimonas pratensis TaxID=279113 RepID=A0A127PYC0_9BURK|nr:hypothetical protein CPter91_0431 [Collimonas pratensis]
MAMVEVEYTNVHGALKVALEVPAMVSSYSAAIYVVGIL